MSGVVGGQRMRIVQSWDDVVELRSRVAQIADWAEAARGRADALRLSSEQRLRQTRRQLDGEDERLSGGA
jgi:ElaB/YqjD/DUF883 family membrane-anchored ribosome-binding protein